jgi:dolichol-phosphate mannosyltransferase
MPTLSIILPTYNEAGNIGRLIQDISVQPLPDFEIIVVDDDSDDGTRAEVERLAQSNVRVIHRVGERGLASAIARGIADSTGRLVVWMDADGTMPPALLCSMVDALNFHDVAVGSRYVKGGRDLRDPVRTIPSRLVNGLARAVLGRGIYDYDSGFVAVSRKVIQTVPLKTDGYGEYCIDFLYRCVKGGFSVTEIGYVFRERSVGVSKSFENLPGLLRLGSSYVLQIFKSRFPSVF